MSSYWQVPTGLPLTESSCYCVATVTFESKNDRKKFFQANYTTNDTAYMSHIFTLNCNK